MTKKTQEEIDALKASWRKDPCWDIEDSDGFEEHKEELIAYRLEVEAEAERKAKERKVQRAKWIEDELGITNPTGMQSLSTFTEIESELKSCDSSIGEAATDGEMATLVIAQAQARATLVLAAQVKRIADHLSQMRDEHDADVEREEIRNLYKM